MDLYNPASIKVLRKELEAFMARRSPDDPKSPTRAEIADARTTGTWRDRELLHHDEVIERILAARRKLDPRELAEAFVFGLGEMKLHYWSPLNGYAISTHLATHEPRYPYPNFPCADCGLYRQISGEPLVEVDWNSALLAQYETGGSAYLASVMANLEDYPHLPRPFSPTTDHVQRLRELLEILRAQPANSSPGKLIKAIGARGGKNDLQRTALVEILANLGILEPANHPSYHRQWVAYMDREGPDGRNDWEYPAIWWRGTDGVNEEAVRHWFGFLLE